MGAEPTDPLASIQALNAYVLTIDEEAAFTLLKRERKGRRRKSHLLRIHARFNRLRAARERAELIQGAR